MLTRVCEADPRHSHESTYDSIVPGYTKNNSTRKCSSTEYYILWFVGSVRHEMRYHGLSDARPRHMHKRSKAASLPTFEACTRLPLRGLPQNNNHCTACKGVWLITHLCCGCPCVFAWTLLCSLPSHEDSKFISPIVEHVCGQHKQLLLTS